MLELVRPALASGGTYVYPRQVRTSPGAKGGALTGDRVVRALCQALRERGDTYVTTFFDLYGLPGDFPGRREDTAGRDSIARCKRIEQSLHRVVTEQAQRRSDRFVPHIQPHEYEALLLADTTAFVEFDESWSSAETELAKAVVNAGSPEHVNDGSATHPSALLKRALPGYRKVTHGAAIATAIGLDRIRAECRHFGAWLGRMESLRPLNRGPSE